MLWGRGARGDYNTFPEAGMTPDPGVKRQVTHTWKPGNWRPSTVLDNVGSQKESINIAVPEHFHTFQREWP